jgi:hypothetical protein
MSRAVASAGIMLALLAIVALPRTRATAQQAQRSPERAAATVKATPVPTAAETPRHAGAGASGGAATTGGRTADAGPGHGRRWLPWPLVGALPLAAIGVHRVRRRRTTQRTVDRTVAGLLARYADAAARALQTPPSGVTAREQLEVLDELESRASRTEHILLADRRRSEALQRVRAAADQLRGALSAAMHDPGSTATHLRIMATAIELEHRITRARDPGDGP